MLTKRRCKWVVLAELQSANLLLNHENPRIFGEPQMGCINLQVLYISYRVALALYATVVLVQGALQAGLQWMPDFTFWTLLVLVVGLNLQAITVIIHGVILHRKGHEAPDVYASMPVHMKITWIFFNIGYTWPFIITPIYWSVFYSPGTEVTFWNSNVHISNLVIVFVDLFVTGMPVRWLHFWQSSVFGMVYLVFSTVWWKTGHTTIYIILDWTNPGRTAGACIAVIFIAVPLAKLLIWLIFQARMSAYGLCEDKQNKPHFDTTKWQRSGNAQNPWENTVDRSSTSSDSITELPQAAEDYWTTEEWTDSFARNSQPPS